MANRYLKVMLVIYLIVTLLAPALLAGRASAQENDPGGWSGEAPPQAGSLGLSLNVPGASRLAYHEQTGMLSFMGTQPGQAIPQPQVLPPGTSAETAALSFLGVYGAMFGLSDPANELATLSVKAGENGHAYVRFQQTHQGTPVMGGEMIVQMDGKQDVVSVNGEVLPGETSIAATPTVAADAAVVAAKAAVAKEYSLAQESLTVSAPELWIYSPAILGSPGDQTDRLVWRMEVTPVDLQPVRELVLVDAQKGGIVLSINQIDSAKVRQIYNNENDYTRGLPGSGGIVRAEGAPATGIADVDRAYDYSGITYDFYSSTHGRDSLDGLGLNLVSTVNFCPDPTCGPGNTYQNAFWNGVQMVYGAGFAAADDVVAHELTHGVTENESNLFYYMQSGAINESFSDIWGEFVDLTYDGAFDNDAAGVRWYLGEDVPVEGTPPPYGGAIRNMANPPEFNDPDKMSSTLYYCGAGDGGGVHTNSGVGNKAAYLIADGGVFNGFTITGIGIPKAARIFYEAQTRMLTSAADYQDLAESLSQACNNLVGTSGITELNCANVREAIAAVEMTRQPAACAANEAPVCDVYGFNSTFNSSLSGWSQTSGPWATTSNYAQSIGTPDTFATLASNNSYGDFEYTALVRRYGCPTCANGLLIRGTPSPLQVYNRWNTDYAFMYTRDGSVSVWKRSGGMEDTLLNWTPSEAVITGDSWNTIKVVASGEKLFYYLNDHLVWSGMDNGYTFGQVGVTMFRNASSTGDLFQVDAASLAGGTPLPLFYDSFEHGLEFWSHAATSGLDPWMHETSYASSGSYELYGPDINSAADYHARMTEAVALPGGQNAFLRFRHAYDFEGSTTAYDGGVIEYSTNNGTTWSDAASLVVNNGYNKTLSNSYGNPLGGRSAFGAASSGYISTRLNLASLAGSSFLFRFRVGTDTSTSDLGWMVDEVKMYTCMERGEKVHLPMLMHSEAATGFTSHFMGSNPGWQPQAGAWTVNGDYMGTPGIPNAISSVNYWQTFGDLDYTVRMQRTGCTTCANRVIIRGEPQPLLPSRNWRSGYLFQYTNSGSYSIFSFVNGSQSTLQGWTPTAAIVPGGYNLLRVVATGTSLSFYINGTLVWSGTDTGLSNGVVGIGMFRDSYSEENWLDVDYAILSGGSALLQGGEIEREQAALNNTPLSGGTVDIAP